MFKKVGIFLFLFLFANIIIAQTKDSVKVILEKYNFNDYQYSNLPIDTELTGFQVYNPAIIENYNNVSLGNIGLPVLQIDELNSYNTNDFIFSNSLKPYFFNCNNIFLYKTNRRFTNVSFFNNGSKSKAQNVVKLFHTQNLNPYLNVSFKYNLINSLGEYKNQSSKDNMLNFTTYYDKNRFTSVLSVNNNSLSYKNNGGIVNDSSVFDVSSYQTELIPVNLLNSISSFKNVNLNFISRYNFGTKRDTVISDSSVVSEIHRKSFIEYKFKLDKNKYLYSDLNNNNYFENYYYSDSASFDSLTSLMLSNSISISNINNKSSKLNYALGLNFDINKFHFTNFSSLRSDAYINLLLKYNAIDYKLILNTDYYVDGFKMGDYDVYADLFYKKFNFEFSNNIVTPNYFISNLFTNNFIWHNNFNKTLYFNLLAKYNYDKNLMFDLKVSSVSNYIFFDSLCLPKQMSNAFLYLKFNIYKKFKLKSFRFITSNTLQYLPSNLEFNLPLFTTYNSFFYQTFLVKNVLKMQIGLDLFYNSNFKGYGYMPSLSIYYVSDEFMGGYPQFDSFINLKLKRATFTLKFIHINQNVFGGKYISIANYPLAERGIRFGISWNFYD